MRSSAIRLTPTPPAPGPIPQGMAGTGPTQARLPGGNLHLHHGPIDLVIRLEGDISEVQLAEAQAYAAFSPLLDSIVSELSTLKAQVSEPLPLASHPVAQAMVRAAWPYRDRFITPMAAVAGSVAQYVLSRAVEGRSLRRAFVNNGGDIALWLSEGESLTLGVISRLDAPSVDTRVSVTSTDRVCGIATSGWGGRSFSLGIADAVTVFAMDAPSADAAATVIANAVNVEHPGVKRVPANSIQPDTDLGDLPVTVGVDIEDREALAQALDSGTREAARWVREGTIRGAMLYLKGACRTVGWPGAI